MELMSTSEAPARSRFLSGYRWNEDSLLGRACFAYNKESSKVEHWGHGSNPINRHAISMRAALLALGFSEEELDPTTARRLYEDD